LRVAEVKSASATKPKLNEERIRRFAGCEFEIQRFLKANQGILSSWKAEEKRKSRKSGRRREPL
jgi:hypothetical protein